ncbi:unnamed protein product [Adineta steineri]|uniref:Uncharacterized protein n=1 Tax=Adineta steineri TaxID=433720 RepID=A0A818H952_9BILA|nr:unnamed protein product [Adineta steineri]CAF3500306.1 unnamed protein product [Adineta steineri]
MGNQSSRVAPAKSLHILDTQTRTRYKNQRENNNLRRKIRNIGIQHHDELTRLTYGEQDVKLKLHQLHYDRIQRDLYKKIDQPRPKTTGSSFFNVAHLDNPPPRDSDILILHNLYESQVHDRANAVLHKSSKASDKVQPLSGFQKFQLQYSSRFEMNQNQLEQNEKHLATNKHSLKKETELMKKSIKTAVAKAARDSNVVIRRGANSF